MPPFNIHLEENTTEQISVLYGASAVSGTLAWLLPSPLAEKQGQEANRSDLSVISLPSLHGGIEICSAFSVIWAKDRNYT